MAIGKRLRGLNLLWIGGVIVGMMVCQPNSYILRSICVLIVMFAMVHLWWWCLCAIFVNNVASSVLVYQIVKNVSSSALLYEI